TALYAVGVLLYELLTGTTPFDKDRLKQAGFDEMRRIIREEEPPRPSTRISTLGPAAATVSANRQSDPTKLSRFLRGELDWIVMKALEKDRNRRYETASAFAVDVQRYLHDEPVLACPPSAGYRFRKFARRNKRAVVTAVVMALAVVLTVAGPATSTVLIARQQQATAEALEDKTKALQAETKAKDDREQALEREKETTYLQRIALAGRELAAGNVGRAEELLDACPEHLRGWEWHFLKRQRYDNAPPLQHPETVIRVVFSPDGRQIASACMQGELAIRDARTGEVLHPLETQTVPARKHRLVR